MHTIIHLDQSYLSDIAKATSGHIKDPKQSQFWQSLFGDLQKGVLANKIACPEVEFHTTEAMYDTRIEGQTLKVLGELSWGLKFRSWESILNSQIEDAARMFLGKKPQEREPWVIAFESDPYDPVEKRMHDEGGTKGQISVHFTLPQEVVSHDRQGKRNQLARVQEYSEEYRSNPRPWTQLLLEQKRGVLDYHFGRPALKSITNRLQEHSHFLDRVGAIEDFNRIVDLANRLQDTGLDITDPNMVANFMQSDQLLNIPFVEINASIWAAVIESCSQGREPQEGDLYDPIILAIVLPYCDVVTTDGFMKEIVTKKLHLDDKYKVMVFSGTRQDQLSFQEFARGLLRQEKHTS